MHTAHTAPPSKFQMPQSTGSAERCNCAVAQIGVHSPTQGKWPVTDSQYISKCRCITSNASSCIYEGVVRSLDWTFEPGLNGFEPGLSVDVKELSGVTVLQCICNQNFATKKGNFKLLIGLHIHSCLWSVWQFPYVLVTYSHDMSILHDRLCLVFVWFYQWWNSMLSPHQNQCTQLIGMGGDIERLTGIMLLYCKPLLWDIIYQLTLALWLEIIHKYKHK